MSETSFLKRRWKLLLNVATVVALAVLAYAIRHQLADTLDNLAKVNAWLLLLMIPVQWANYHSQTKMYQGLFRVVGNRLSYRSLFRTSLELNFVNHVFPSGGVSGISYFGVRMRSGDITGSRAALVQLMKLVLLFLSFEVLLVFGLLALAVGNKASNLIILVTSSIFTLMIVGTVALAAILGSERRIKGTFTYLGRGVNRLIHLVRPRHPETIRIARLEHAIMDLHTNYKVIESRWKELKWPFFWALMANLTELASIYVVYIAFGEWVNVGAVILAYAVANFAGLVSVLPGGVGVYEALMTGVLSASGVPAALSLPVTVMYRVLNTLIQLPPGYYFYHKSLHSGQAERMREMHDD